MYKNVIVDRLKSMTQGPSPKLFKVFEHEDGPRIMKEPWGKAKKLTWEQAEALAGMDSPAKKPVASSTTSRRESGVKRRKTG